MEKTEWQLCFDAAVCLPPSVTEWTEKFYSGLLDLYIDRQLVISLNIFPPGQRPDAG